MIIEYMQFGLISQKLKMKEFGFILIKYNVLQFEFISKLFIIRPQLPDLFGQLSTGFELRFFRQRFLD